MAHQEGHTLVLLNTLGLTGAELTRATIENNRRKREFEQSEPEKPPVKPLPKGNYTVNRFKLNMSQMRDKIGNLALTNNYQVEVPLLPKVDEYIKEFYSNEYESIKNFVKNKMSFYCSEATLPVSSYATAEVKDNFLGVTQEFAHTRLYTDLDFTFYVDANYDVLRYFEIWMDFISGASEDVAPQQFAGYNKSNEYYRRFKYPNDYKSPTMSVIKFERDYKQQLTYAFVNAFPKALTSIPVSYGSADLLKVTATFNYDRYVVTRQTFT